MRIIVAADLHLHPYRECSRDNGADRLADGLSAMRQTLDHAREHGADAWIHAGDLKLLKDKWHDSALVGALELLREYRGLRLVLIRGNHDGVPGRESGLDPFRELSNVMVHEEPLIATVDGGTERVGIWPWVQDHRRALELLPLFLKEARRAKARLLIGHAMLVGAAVGPAEHAMDKGLGLGEIGLGLATSCPFRLGVFGHVHKPQELGGGSARYVGNPYAQNWGEREEWRGCLLVDTESLKVTPLPVAAPRFRLEDWTAVRGSVRGDQVGDWRGDFVRVLISSQTDPKLVERVREASGARVWQTVVRPEPPEERPRDQATAMHAGLSKAELLGRYVTRHPPADLPADAVLKAGLQLLEGQ